MDTLPITLIVKAPNQLIEDQTIQCESTWSVKRLKEHLSHVYPSKPSPNDQKLIYSGHLLNDTVVLKDILREYGGPKCIYTLHLVCTPKHVQKIATTPVTRNNLVPELTNENPPMPIPNDPALTMILNERVPNLNYHNTGHYNYQFMVMQQAYVQYMQHYMNIAHLQQFGVPLPGLSGLNLINEYNNRFNQPGLEALRYRYNAAVPGDVENFGANVGPAEGAVPLNVGADNIVVHFEQLQQLAARNQDAPADLEQPPAQVQQLRGIGLNDDHDHRDWLEHFYMVCRIMIFISIVYFYSSATRFIVVLFTAVCLYLYQIGFFRNININNNDINANQRRPRDDIAAGEIAGLARAPGVPLAADIAGTDFEYTRPHQRVPSRLTVVWTFVTTFLASLLPEIPNVV